LNGLSRSRTAQSAGRPNLLSWEHKLLEYRLDDLHWAEFERLCQALLKAKLGVGVEAWSGAGDGGNDAYYAGELRYPGTEVEAGPFQFQVKFVQGANAAGAKPKGPLLTAVRRECDRFKERTGAEPRIYSLLTNASLSRQARDEVRRILRASLPGCTQVIIHDGNDLCSWLHDHPSILRKFPQLLSHRDLADLIQRSTSESSSKLEVPVAPEPSAALRRKIKQARTASRRHNVMSATRLWTEVSAQAQAEGLTIEAIKARLQIALNQVRDGNLDDGLGLAEACLRDASGIELGEERCRLNQMIGEIYRNKGDADQARGFLTAALTNARNLPSPGDEGFALLALSALDHSSDSASDNTRSFELINLAYDAFSQLYASGDREKQKDAQHGFAQCHSWRADILGYRKSDEAIAELSRAVDCLTELGKGWEWDLGDALVSRGELLARAGDISSAADDLSAAEKQLNKIREPFGLARCYLVMAEIIDRSGDRDKAEPYYYQAAAAATSSRNESRSAYYYFRYAWKLVEQRKYDLADNIFVYLLKADWLGADRELDVVSQLCLTAQARGAHDALKERATLALSMVEKIRGSAKSASRARELDLKRGHFLELLARYDEAERCYRGLLQRLDPNADSSDAADCWFRIRGLMQQIGDRLGEREACEKCLSVGGSDLNPVIRSITLISLAQLNIQDERYSEAKTQLDIAKNIDPTNPAVKIIERDLRSNLPVISLLSSPGAEVSNSPPDTTFANLIRELHRWTHTFPEKDRAILSVWYYIHRRQLWDILRSALGVKFLISTEKISSFDRARDALGNYGDLFVWGVNFSLKAKSLRGINGVEQVPVPENYLFPGGTTLVTPKQDEPSPRGKRRQSDLLGPQRETKPESYYLAFMKSDNDPGGVAPFFVGRKQVWRDTRVPKFMLGRSAAELIEQRAICLPLSESDKAPTLLRSLHVARANSAIPIFLGRLPASSGVASICDCTFALPTKPNFLSPQTRGCWERLVDSCAATPKLSLNELVREMSGLTETTGDQLTVRAYALRFRDGENDVIHPAMVILDL
jgi:tetratricopeptide (TPR) repeat protein